MSMVGEYEPNEQDEIIGDAMAVGGPAFVEELHYAAMEAAEAVVPWDGNGEEPAAYRAIWVAFARKMVLERRLALRAGPADSRYGREDGPGSAPDTSVRPTTTPRRPRDPRPPS